MGKYLYHKHIVLSYGCSQSICPGNFSIRDMKQADAAVFYLHERLRFQSTKDNVSETTENFIKTARNISFGGGIDGSVDSKMMS